MRPKFARFKFARWSPRWPDWNDLLRKRRVMAASGGILSAPQPPTFFAKARVVAIGGVLCWIAVGGVYPQLRVEPDPVSAETAINSRHPMAAAEAQAAVAQPAAQVAAASAPLVEKLRRSVENRDVAVAADRGAVPTTDGSAPHGLQAQTPPTMQVSLSAPTVSPAVAAATSKLAALKNDKTGLMDEARAEYADPNFARVEEKPLEEKPLAVKKKPVRNPVVAQLYTMPDGRQVTVRRPVRNVVDSRSAWWDDVEKVTRPSRRVDLGRPGNAFAPD
jgi:hypothetical protein